MLQGGRHDMRLRVRTAVRLLIGGSWVLAASDVLAAEAISERNWLNHPDIVEVRSIYQEIKAAKDAGKLKKVEREFNYCKPYEDTVRTLYTGQNGTPRIYQYQGGSDDSAVQRELYYDEN